MRTLALLGIFAGILAFLAHAQIPASDPLDSYSPEDLAKGKKLFQAHCGPCHGFDGTGGRGANLTVPKLKRATDNQAFFDLAKYGIPGTIMDGAWQLSDAELWRVVAYTRSLGKTARVELPGDAARGAAAYRKSGCAGCHAIQGQGGSLGPELTAIGARRSAAYLKEAIVDPGATVPEEYLMVRAKPRDGKEVRGMRVNEDSFTVQIKDLSGRYHSFRKADLTSLDREPKQSAMPSYQSKLSAAELDDLIAYLAGLRGE
jgi:putative heme-binding domain-containing protein